MVGAKIGHQYFEGATRFYLCFVHRARISIAHLFGHGVDARTQALLQTSTETKKHYLGTINESDQIKTIFADLLFCWFASSYRFRWNDRLHAH